MPAAEHLDEDRVACVVGADDLAVEDDILDAEPLRQRPRERVQVLKVMPVARDEVCAGIVDFEERPVRM